MTLAWADGTAAPLSAGDEAAQISMPSVVSLPDQCDRAWKGIRTRTRKLILGDDGSPWLLYDLENDPLELRNLAADHSRAGEIRALASRVRS
jgi:hypothetical protein